MERILRGISAARATRHPFLVPYVALAGCLVGTLALILVLGRYAEVRDQARFDNAIQSTRDRIENRLDTYVAMLAATRGLFATDRGVTAQDFRHYVSQLDLPERYPGIQGIGFSRRFAAAYRGELEAEMHAQGQEGFRVWPLEPPRDEYHAILFLEPLDRRNRAAIGYDMSSEPVRREAMARARDTAAPAASGPVTLVQEIDEVKKAGFLIYLPLYRGSRVPPTVEERRERLLGFVYGPFRVDDMLAGLFGSEREPRVAFSVHDGPPSAGALLHRSPGFEETAGADLVAVETVEVAGRLWTLTFRSRPAFERMSSDWLIPWMGALGLLGSALVFAVLQRRARGVAQLRLHSLILESMSEGVTVAAADGTILYTNPAQDAMFGYQRGELVGRHLAEVVELAPRASRERVTGILAALRGSGRWAGELSNVRKDGSTFLTLARMTSLVVASQPHWVSVQEDVTERRRAEREREELLTRAQAARADAETANRAKDEFLAMLGHELRNPLAPIVTALELLSRGSPAAAERAQQVIRRQVGYVVRLVDDLLDVSRITRGKVVLERAPVELAAVAAQALEVAQPVLAERRQQVRVDVPAGLVVDGDLQRLSQVLANLLTNAAKYGRPGGNVAVVAQREGGEAVLRVRDDGIGIPPDLLPRVFDLFAQGPQDLDRSRGGLGIGLTLVRNLVGLHGGSVSAHSEGEGRGSEFVVRLPLAPAPAADAPAMAGGSPAAAAERPLAHPASPRRVLVVDDNREAADLAAELLRGAGHDVCVAYDAEQALAAAAQHRPEVAVLDLGLPGMDGYELARRLGAGAEPPGLVALTGYGQESHRAQAREAGFRAHLVKPAPPEALLSAIDEVATPAGVEPR